MSGTEDYLDGLLNSISEKDLDTKKKTGSETMQTEEDIMNDMENDLLSKEAEDNFLEQFEKELQNEKSSPEEEKTDDFFNSLDQIVDGADHNNNDDDFLMDTLGDIPGIDDVTKTEGLSQAQTMEKEPDEQSEDTAEPAQASDDAGSDTFGMDDAGSTGLDDFGDLGGADMFGDSEAEETEITPDGIEETPKKEGFLKKLSRILFGEDDEDEKKKKEAMTQEERKAQEEKEKKQEKAMMGGTVAFSIVFALGLFFFLPYFLSGIFHKVIASDTVIALLEGLIRLAIFIGYIALISLTPDIKRVFMYHGAEHKCINCIEHGMELNVENVRKSSRQHKRCGTSFLLIVMLISIVFFLFIRVDSRILQLVLRLLLIPVIAGVSYEFIRLAGRYDNRLVNILSKPGLWMQKMTTKEPDDEMIEVGIASVEAVFDWRKWQKEENV